MKKCTMILRCLAATLPNAAPLQTGFAEADITPPIVFYAMREHLQNPALPARSLLLALRLVVRESCGA